MAYVNMGQDFDTETRVVFAHSSAQDRTMVPMSDLTVTTTKPKFQWTQFGTAVFSFVFCNCTFGLLGLAYAVLSYVDYKTGDFFNLERKKSCGWWWIILALAIGTVGWCVLVYMTVMFHEPIADFTKRLTSH